MLDATHTENMQWMLRCLRVDPYKPADTTAEAMAFYDLAYGATLGLIYFRALTVPMRDRWDAKMADRVKKMQCDLSEAETTVRTTFVAAQGGYTSHASQPYQAWTTSIQALNTIRPVLQKRLSLLGGLLARKQRAFSQNSDEAVNEDVKVGQNPWCQSDSEFEQVVAGELAVSVPNAKPVVPRGFGTEPKEEGAAGKLLNTVITSKASKFIDMLLEMGEDRIAEALAKEATRTALYVVRRIPLSDLIIDWIKDQVASNALGALVQDYRVDRDRRLFLKRLNWGTYQDPGTPRPPEAGDFSRQVLR